MSKSNRQAEWFIREIVEGRSLMDTATISSISDQLGIPLSKGGYFCMVVGYADGESVLPNIQLAVQLQNACMNACRKLGDDAFCYIGNQFCVVMLVSDEGKTRTEIAEKVYRHIIRNNCNAIRIGVGRSYSELDKISYSRVEAFEALNDLNSADSISYIDDVYVTRSSTTRKLESEKSRIIEKFKAGQFDQMMEYMVRLAENIRKESPAREGMPYPTSIRRTVLEILFEIMHISADAGVDVEAVLNYQDPYSHVFEIDDTPEILVWFRDLATVLYKSAAELSSRTEKNMLTLAKKQIEEHISDPELSLSLISDHLGITPSYFSAFFIREMGIGFLDYITDLRISHAKELLQKTNQKINTIASECGFRSASYFINVFRKQTGMSPGEYRNMK